MGYWIKLCRGFSPMTHRSWSPVQVACFLLLLAACNVSSGCSLTPLALQQRHNLRSQAVCRHYLRISVGPVFSSLPWTSSTCSALYSYIMYDTSNDVQGTKCSVLQGRMADGAYAGLLYALLREAPESLEMLLAAPSDGVLTLWKLIGTGGHPVQTSAAGTPVLQPEPLLE